MLADHILPPDTQAILLLCGYFGGDDRPSVKPLTLSEYNRLATQLRAGGFRPADMLEGESEQRFEDICASVIAPERLRALLERGVQMSFAVEEWSRQGIWVVSRGDASYPQVLKDRLKQSAPPLLFGVGDKGMLNRGGLGVVGSRDADDTALQFARRIAGRCASEHVTLVSGGARGVDRAAMDAALAGGGYVLGILPEGVAKVAVTKANREPIAEGKLTLVSPYHPHARWTRGNAMGRNRHIYALSDWTLVVSSATEGGTWSGAVEALKKGWGRVVVRSAADVPEGNVKLIQKGGKPLKPEAVERAASMQDLLNGLFQAEKGGRNGTLSLFSALEEEASQASSESEEQSSTVSEPKPDSADEDVRRIGDERSVVFSPDVSKDLSTSTEISDLFDVVWPRLQPAFADERPEKELRDLAVRFNVQVGQLKAWVRQAVERGYLEKRTRPIRYVLKHRNEIRSSQ